MAMEDLRAAAVLLRDKANDLVTVINDINNALDVGTGIGGDAVGQSEALAQSIQTAVLSGVQTDIGNAYTALAAITVDPIVPET